MRGAGTGRAGVAGIECVCVDPGGKQGGLGGGGEHWLCLFLLRVGRLELVRGVPWERVCS